MAIKNIGTQRSPNGGLGAKGRNKKEKDFEIAVTAEIPQISQQEVYSLQLPLSPGARKHQKKKPAPFAVRALVWVLVFLVIITGGGIWAEHSHSVWFRSLRNTGTHATGKTGISQSVRNVKKTLSKPYGTVVQGVNKETIFVPASGYDVNITVNKPCWVKIYSPSDSSNILFEQVLQPSSAAKTLQVTGSAKVTFGAVVESFSITVGSKLIFQTSNPKILPYNYILTTE